MSPELKLLWATIVPNCDDCEYDRKPECIEYRDTCEQIWAVMKILDSRERGHRQLVNKLQGLQPDDSGWITERRPTAQKEYLVVRKKSKTPEIMKFCKDRWGIYWKDGDGRVVQLDDVVKWQFLPKV